MLALPRYPAPLLTLSALFVLLGGCSVNGSYPDAIEPDAAKLRFVANTSNATLDYFDAAHCDGQTTGILNNLLLSDTARRVGMSVPAPKDAKGYLEVKLKPGEQIYLRTNMNSGYAVCGKGFNFTPEANAEYEVTFKSEKNFCLTQLQRLQRVDGKDVRTPIPILKKDFPACAGRNALFPKTYPDTPHRLELMKQVIDKSLVVTVKTDPTKEKIESYSPEKLDTLISERKAKLGFDLPPDYWALYRENLKTFGDDMAQNKARSLERFKDEYQTRLRQVKDEQLEQWALPKNTNAKPEKAEIDLDVAMMVEYFRIGNGVTGEAVGHHLERMAQMDERYGVCARFAECWKRN